MKNFCISEFLQGRPEVFPILEAFVHVSVEDPDLLAMDVMKLFRARNNLKYVVASEFIDWSLERYTKLVRRADPGRVRLEWN